MSWNEMLYAYQKEKGGVFMGSRAADWDGELVLSYRDEPLSLIHIFMELDLNARQTLELTETLRGKEKKGSLLWVLDKTRTAMGRRLIRGWMERPLLSPVQINRRQQAVSDLVEDIITREEVVLCRKEITDLERLIGRVVYGTAGGRDLAALSAGLGRLPRLRELLEGDVYKRQVLVGRLDYGVASG